VSEFKVNIFFCEQKSTCNKLAIINKWNIGTELWQKSPNTNRDVTARMSAPAKRSESGAHFLPNPAMAGQKP